MVTETFEMKPGRGRHTYRNGNVTRVLRPGDTITCEESELNGALDKFVKRGPTPEQAQQAAQGPRGLKIIHRGGGWFDVVNQSTNVRLNDEALRKGDAYGLVMDVTGVDASALVGLEDAPEGPINADGEDASQIGVETAILGPRGGDTE